MNSTIMHLAVLALLFTIPVAHPVKLDTVLRQPPPPPCPNVCRHHIPAAHADCSGLSATCTVSPCPHGVRCRPLPPPSASPTASTTPSPSPSPMADGIAHTCTVPRNGDTSEVVLVEDPNDGEMYAVLEVVNTEDMVTCFNNNMVSTLNSIIAEAESDCNPNTSCSITNGVCSCTNRAFCAGDSVSPHIQDLQSSYNTTGSICYGTWTSALAHTCTVPGNTGQPDDEVVLVENLEDGNMYALFQEVGTEDLVTCLNDEMFETVMSVAENTDTDCSPNTSCSITMGVCACTNRAFCAGSNVSPHIQDLQLSYNTTGGVCHGTI